MEYTKKGGAICVFGDSITWGAWDKKYHGWVTRLQLSIEERFGYKHEIYNIGVSGDTSRELLRRIDKESAQRFENTDAKKWLQRKNNSMLIEIGENDAKLENNKQKVTSKEFRENLRKILKIARKYVDNIAFLSCGPVDDSRTDPWIYDETQRYSSKSYEKYSAIIKEFCKDNDVLFIDVYNPLKKSKEDVLDEEDGLHLNDIGHKIIAKVVEKAIVKAGFVKK